MAQAFVEAKRAKRSRDRDLRRNDYNTASRLRDAKVGVYGEMIVYMYNAAQFPQMTAPDIKTIYEAGQIPDHEYDLGKYCSVKTCSEQVAAQSGLTWVAQLTDKIVHNPDSEDKIFLATANAAGYASSIGYVHAQAVQTKWVRPYKPEFFKPSNRKVALIIDDIWDDMKFSIGQSLLTEED